MADNLALGRSMKKRLTPDGSPTGLQPAACARAFAIKAHGEQKYGDQPYSVHLDDVARRVRELGFTSVEHEIVAYLHDVLEYTEVSPAELEEKFGAKVRGAVEQLTGDLDDPEYLKRMDELAFSVKLAELLSNVAALGLSGAGEPQRLRDKYSRAVYASFLKAWRLGKPYLDAHEVFSHESILAGVRVPIPDPAAYLSGYFIVGERPVKVVKTGDHAIDVLAYDWATGEFARDASYLSKVTFGVGEVEKVTREEFEAEVERLRAGRR